MVIVRFKMKKSLVILASLLFGMTIATPNSSLAATPKDLKTKDTKEQQTEQTTRSDAVIFKVHDVKPVAEEGVVSGCDFTVTLFNRTAINFRNFTINMTWDDVVDEKFKFDRYVEAVMGKEDLDKFKEVIKEETPAKPLGASVTVNAFGANKQISVRSHVNSEKCYLMLKDATFNVSPCDIARNVNSMNDMALADTNECTGLFQFVSTANPEYYGKFKSISITEEAQQNEITENQELSDIDDVISKIVENLGVSDNTLNNIN